MNGADFANLCRVLWSCDWKASAATAFGVSVRTVEFWSAEAPARSKPVPIDVQERLLSLVGLRMDRLAADVRTGEFRLRRKGVHHIDGDPSNNDPANLRWVNYGED